MFDQWLDPMGYINYHMEKSYKKNEEEMQTRGESMPKNGAWHNPSNYSSKYRKKRKAKRRSGRK